MPQLQEGDKTNITRYQTLAPAPATYKHNIDRKENIKTAAQKKQRSTFNSQQCSSMTGIINNFFYQFRFCSVDKNCNV